MKTQTFSSDIGKACPIRAVFKRKLATILSADVAGYSRLMSEDEAATVNTITAYREILAKLIKKHHGRVVDSAGDNVLAEFASVVNGVKCAVAIQKEIQACNADSHASRRMQFRIGLNLGDVIEEGKRIYGDGVNIAARLQSMADPGGICISRPAFDQIDTKLPLKYAYLGEKTVKNIPKPVGVYKILTGTKMGTPKKNGTSESASARPRKIIPAAFIGILLVAFLAAAVWNIYSSAPTSEKMAPSEQKVLPLSNKPVLAVLPFVNMSDDRELVYFSDGMTEDIITALSAVPKLSVIARNSTFVYKGKSVNVKKVGRELGAGYVLEGSIQRADERVRITAQLIDAATDRHIWAERFDREFKDIFALQDEIVLKIMRALQLNLSEGQQHTIKRKAPRNLDSYVSLLKGQDYFMRLNRESNAKARQLFEKAAALDPAYSPAYLMLARTYLREVWHGWSRSTGETLSHAETAVKQSLALDPADAGNHGLLSQIYLFRGQYEKAIREGERAFALGPNSVEGYGALGMSLYYAGRYEEALGSFEKAVALEAFPPVWLINNLGNSYLMVGRYGDAIATYKKALLRNPKSQWAHVGTAAAFSMAGYGKEARSAAAQLFKVIPSFSLDYFERTLPYRNQADKERFVNALYQAGLSRKNDAVNEDGLLYQVF